MHGAPPFEELLTETFEKILLVMALETSIVKVAKAGFAIINDALDWIRNGMTSVTRILIPDGQDQNRKSEDHQEF